MYLFSKDARRMREGREGREGKREEREEREGGEGREWKKGGRARYQGIHLCVGVTIGQEEWA